MDYQIAILVHSWFSWVTARAITSKLDPSGEKTLYILSREFDPGNDLPKTSAKLRFESFETIYTHQLRQNEEKHILHSLKWFRYAEQLLVPHILYYPFRRLAEEKCFHKVSFYQESLQCPPGTLCEREALLLKESSSDTTLFTTDRTILHNKITMKYYNLNEEMVPLHLRSIITGEVVKAANMYLPERREGRNLTYEYAIVAGKSMNSAEGIQLISSIVDCISHQLPETSILFKASPSSSREVQLHVKNLTQVYPFLSYRSSTDSIERDILDGKINILITEMFSLAALFLMNCHDKTRIVSIEATILRDYISLESVLTERIKIKRFRKYALSFQSLSQHILSKLATS